jgi:carboxymethylenebutenolidase
LSRQDLTLKTRDGDMRCFSFTPDTGSGPWPGAIMYMDAIAIRPTMFEMAQRVADMGYSVLLPDMFWRLGPYEPQQVGYLFAHRDELTKMVGSTDADKSMSDTGACVDWFASQGRDRIGVWGYCMGGMLALRAAGTFPESIVAAAAFHAGNVVTDKPDSVHLLAGRTRAKVLMAGADKDDYFTAAQCETLDKAYRDAGVDAEVSIWEGKLHGYAPPDMPVYDKEASERHYEALKTLFRAKL